MQTVEQIKSDNFQKIRPIYEDFRQKALKEYRYQDQPIEFEYFTSAIEKNNLGGLVLFEDETPQGILIYSTEKYEVLEINVVHSTNRFALLEEFLKQQNNNPACKIISYPMLGMQETSVKDISHLGFKFVGQSTVKFDVQDPVSYRVLKMSGEVDLRENSISMWDDKYKEQAIELINLAFKNSKSVNFDPRFLTYEGSKEILELILTNQYGVFLPYQSRILVNGDSLEGFCFAVMATEDKINVPLVAIRKNERNKGMGKILLKSLISGFARLIGENKIHLKEINATVDTDNYPAVKMYRRLGFREEYFYPHAYLKTTVL